jgi:uncharacterized membrane protein YheB (UPF0754 family)
MRTASHNLTTQPPPHDEPLVKKEFSQLKRDLAELNLALQRGIDIRTGLVQQEKFDYFLEQLQIDWQLQNPKPEQQAPVDQIISDAQTLSKSASTYYTKRAAMEQQMAVEQEALGQASDALAHQGEFPSAGGRLDAETMALEMRNERMQLALKELQTNCLNSTEWKQLQQAYQQIGNKAITVIKELEVEEQPGGALTRPKK